MDLRREHTLQSGSGGHGPVIYWMSRDQRIQDNWALIHAQERAVSTGRGLVILFCLVPSFLQATARQYGFMLHGLGQTCQESLERHVPWILACGQPVQIIPEYVRKLDAESLICDFDPLRIKKEWREQVAEEINIPMTMVDAHNVVPCWETSNKQEFAARTIRPKIQKKLFEYLGDMPQVHPHPQPAQGLPLQEPDWEEAEKSLNIDTSVPEVDWLSPGPQAGLDMMWDFVHHRLSIFDQQRNDPNARALSNLSPYFHFGQIAPQRVAFEVWRHQEASSTAKEAYLEEMIIRRELSDNYCWYNPAYDSFQGLPEWAQKTLNAHRADPRAYTYSYEQLDTGSTHDDLWNAAQNQMRVSGKMHGYLRMYWAKKILEWTESPEQAIAWAIALNDRYELDGRDPNGYVGVLWSIGGLHDRGFKQRPVFGTIRYMSYAGCKRKFDLQAFVSREG